MPKMMLHDDAAREALGRGISKLARAVRGTLGPRGMNAFIDRPVGSPIVSRDGVSIAAEVELADPFENMGAQVVREVSRQTNEVAGDGTTTATILADALVQGGLQLLKSGANAVELVNGLDEAVEVAVDSLKKQAKPLNGQGGVKAIATIAANNDGPLGELVADAFERAGLNGIVDVQFGVGIYTTLEVLEGMTFDRGYVSHHMVTDVEKMECVLEDPYILLTDNKLHSPEELDTLYGIVKKSGRSLLIVAEDIAPAVLMNILERREKEKVQVAAIHPPDYGHWRKAMLEDIAITTGGRVVARDLGGTIANIEIADLGSAKQVRVSASRTIVSQGGGDPEKIKARREQVMRQFDAAPENIEKDKYQERMAKLSGGTSLILAGGHTPVEQKRRLQLIEDAINATRAAIEEGIVPGGGTALLRILPDLDAAIGRLKDSERKGAELLRSVLSQPLVYIAKNAGRDGAAAVDRVSKSNNGMGLDARSGNMVDMMEAGIVDPVRVSYTAIRNAASVAGLVLTTDTLIAKMPDDYDPTAGPALGGGAELLGLSATAMG